MLTFDGYMQKKSCAILIHEKLLFKTLLTFEMWCFYQNSKRRKRMVGTYKIAECLKWLTKYIFLHKNINSRRKEVRHYSNWMQANLSKFAIYLFYQFKEKKLLTHFVKNESVISPFKVYWHKPCFFFLQERYISVSFINVIICYWLLHCLSASSPP